MVVKDASKFYKHHMGVEACLNVCVQGFIQDFEFWEGGTPQSSALMWRRCIAHNN